VPLFVIGVGTLGGGPLPESVYADGTKEPSPGRSRLDRPSLQRMAAAGGGQYFELDRDPDREIANAIIDAGRRRAPTTIQSGAVQELYWRFLAAAVALAALAAACFRERAELWRHGAGGVFPAPGALVLSLGRPGWAAPGALASVAAAPLCREESVASFGAMNRRWVTAAAPVLLAATLLAQGTHYRARLSVMPLDVAMQATMAGSGTVTATLKGNTLTIAGTFNGLKTPATVARIHRAPRTAMRGPAIADLTATAATSGTISGAVELTKAHVDDLAAGRLYVQLHSEKAPEGNLWGWLLPETKK
jgi:hypothetical protein